MSTNTENNSATTIDWEPIGPPDTTIYTPMTNLDLTNYASISANACTTTWSTMVENAAQTEYIEKLEKHIDELEEDIDYFNKTLEEKNALIAFHDGLIKQFMDQIQELKDQVTTLKGHLDYVDRQCHQLEVNQTVGRKEE